MNTAEALFARAMGGRAYGEYKSAPMPAPKPPTVKHVAAPQALPVPPGLPLGELETGGVITVDLLRLLEGRLLIQGMSGAGKSWTLRRLLEQAAGQVQMVVIDPEGEFESLATELGLLFVKGDQLDVVTARTLGARIREHRTSLVLDVSGMKRTAQMILVTALLEAMVEAPREHWHPCLVAIDEAQLFAPWGDHSEAPASVRKAAVGAVVDVLGRGRKRGLCGVLATLRMRRVATSVRSEIQNFLVGLNTQDLDIERAAEHLGWPKSKAHDRLPELQPGDFVAVGRAFSSQPAILHVGPVQSEHRGSTPALAAPVAIAPDRAREVLGLDDLVAEAATDREAREAVIDGQLQPGARAVRQFIREPAFVLAGRVFGALQKVAPKGVTVKNLADHLEVGIADVAGAVSLLDQYGVLAFTDVGALGPVSIAGAFLREGDR